MEDEAIIAADLTITLKSLGYEVCGVASSYESAMLAVEKHYPDIVLMDIVLQGDKTGLHAANDIRERYRIPVVYLTAHSDSDIIEKAKVTDPFGYLVKPFNVRVLHLTLEMAVFKHQQEQTRRSYTRALKALGCVNDLLLHGGDEDRLLQDICGALVDEGAYGFVWIGAFVNGQVTSMAHAGDSDMLEHLQGDKGIEPHLKVMASRPVRGHGATGSSDLVTIHEGPSRGGHRALLLPLYMRGETWGTMLICSHEDRPLANEEQGLLLEMANNLSFGLAAMHDAKAKLQAEQRYKDLVELSTDLIYQLDPQGNIQYMNDTGCGILEMSHSDLEGKPLIELLHTDDRAQVDKLLTHVPRGSQHIFSFEGRAHSQWGRIIHTLHNVRVIRDNCGKVTGFQGIARDISKRKAMEKKLLDHQQKLKALVKERTVKLHHERAERQIAEEGLIERQNMLVTLFEQALNPLVAIDEHGGFVDVNRAALEFFEVSQEELPKHNLRDMLRTTKAPLMDVLASLDISTSRTIEAFYEIGQRRKTVLLNVVPVMVSGSKQFYVIGQDLTERNKLEEELIKALKLESVGILAGGIAHDFNNILTAIVSNVSLARLSPSLDKKTSAWLEQAEKASFRARDLTQQLLTFSKGGAPVRKLASIEGILRDCAEFALRGANVICKYDIAPDLWDAEVDEGQLSRVFGNIVINADQAMPKGGTITIRATNQELHEGQMPGLQQGRYIVVSIEDQGTGIPEEIQQKIFDPYFTTKQRGSGLGLASTYWVVKRHEGHIDFESHPGKGTTFHIYLPATLKKRRKESHKHEELAHRTGSVLLMDDDVQVREALGATLEFMGYTVAYASNGHEALDKFTAKDTSGHPFDVVVMDLTIPGGMGGVETISELRKFAPKVKAIVTSGYSNNPVMSQHKHFGFDGVLRKPCKIEELSKLLQDLIRA